MIDVWSSNSMQLPRLLRPKDDIPSPRREASFLRMRRTQIFERTTSSAESREEDATSLLTQKIRLNSMLSDIVQLNRLSTADSFSASEILSTTLGLAARLTQWHDSLPESLEDTTENMIAHAASGSGGGFVALHIGFYHFSQLLYYTYLHHSVNDHECSQPIRDFAQRCRENSTSLCELVYAAQALPGAEVYVSISIFEATWPLITLYGTVLRGKSSIAESSPAKTPHLP